MEEVEYAKFVLEDTCWQLLQAAGIYAVALSAYWIFVG
jgi:hypothetical protein